MAYRCLEAGVVVDSIERVLLSSALISLFTRLADHWTMVLSVLAPVHDNPRQNELAFGHIERPPVTH